MASIRREFLIDARPEEVWDAVRDLGALHTRLVPGFVTDCKLEEGARMVTFARGRPVSLLFTSQMISSESCMNHSTRSLPCSTGRMNSSVVGQ